MLDKLDFLCRFWELRARYEALGVPLTEPERVELLSLVQMIASGVEDEPDMAMVRGIPAQLTAGAGFLAADLADVSAECLLVAAAERLAEGTRTVVHIADAVTGVEYALPCIVAWSREDEPCWMGLTVDGVPKRSQFTCPTTGTWRSPLGPGPTGPRVQA